MNLPNKLTLSRFFLAAIFLWCLFAKFTGSYAAALLVFLFASLTDYWDGKIARRRDEITAFGRLMDPIADKVLTLSAFIGFVVLAIMPAWMAIAIIARDFIVTGVRFLIPLRSKAMAARKSGKQKTAVQFVAIVAILCFMTLRSLPGWVPSWTPLAMEGVYWGMFLVVVMTLASGLWYIIANREYWMGQRCRDSEKS